MSDLVVEPSPGPAIASDEASGPVPLGIETEATGNAEIDALLERLRDANALPTESHIEVYEDVHRGLREVLTALDTRPGSPPPHPPYNDRS
ncbi:MAG: hypothetical protein JO362_16575 [Streptomycetaceae bacterium]|nr:hypothetical protein [Streptomycetaceae bacterium]